MRSGVCARHWPQLSPAPPPSPSANLPLPLALSACLLLVFLLLLYALSRQASKKCARMRKGCLVAGGPDISSPNSSSSSPSPVFAVIVVVVSVSLNDEMFVLHSEMCWRLRRQQRSSSTCYGDFFTSFIFFCLLF